MAHRQGIEEQVVERLLTLAEVADIFRISPASLYRQRYVGDAPGALGFRVGRHLRFDPDDLAEWIREQKDEGRNG